MSAAAVIALARSGNGPVEVVGTSALAEELRQVLGERILPTQSGQRPQVIVETTGEAAALEAALQGVADLGMVVIAGPSPPGPVALDLYTDVHVRGLTLAGVPSGEAVPSGVRA